MPDYYDENASVLSERYESVSTPDGHGSWLHLLPSTKCLILDVGAGSGRDAAWMAAQGHEVLAVEQSEELRHDAE